MALKVSLKCPRCEGNGIRPQFVHVKGGICFLCQGATEREVHIHVGPNEVRVGTVTFSRQFFARLDRKGLIAVAAANLKPLRTFQPGGNGLALVRLAIVLALAPQDVRFRGIAAVANSSATIPECEMFGQLMMALVNAHWTS